MECGRANRIVSHCRRLRRLRRERKDDSDVSISGLCAVQDQAVARGSQPFRDGRCDFDVDIAYNRFVVDAKSIVGVFGLDFRYPLTVVCHGYDSRFDNYLKGLALAV